MSVIYFVTNQCVLYLSIYIYTHTRYQLICNLLCNDIVIWYYLLPYNTQFY